MKSKKSKKVKPVVKKVAPQAPAVAVTDTAPETPPMTTAAIVPAAFGTEQLLNELEAIVVAAEIRQTP